ncbi:MAG: zinc ABC transporter substrate-binding protein [Gemmatimonadota bacterium]|nr:MAG: zinc ABC transporter substrate-binding protein [Gemmatimonadota bacterium]
MKYTDVIRLCRAAGAVVLMLSLTSALLEAQQNRNRNRRGQKRVVTSLTTYEAIAREIAADRVEITSLAEGPEDPHFVQPKPSLALAMRRADLLITTGLDLEMWMPALMDKANNPRIASGSDGFVAVATGIDLVEIPETVSRAEGDTHIYGNPHIWNEPSNALIIGENITTGLKRVDPANAAAYDAGFAAWKEKLMRAYLGDELVDILGVDLAADLDRQGELWTFLSTQSYQGRPLTERAAGWLGQLAPYRGREMVCYHKAWSYFARAYGIPCVEYIEPKTGIPPTPRHVAHVISLINERNIPVLLASAHFPRDQVEMVAQRTGATAVIVPASVRGAPNTETFVDLMSLWVTQLAHAFAQSQTAR